MFRRKLFSFHYEPSKYTFRVFWMPQIPFAFELECEWPNDLYTAELPFLCSEIFMFFYWKQLNGNLARYFKIKSICVFECEWPNGNSNDLCTAKLPFGRSHSNSNANGNWGIQNALLFWYSSKDTHFRSLMPNSSCQIHHKEPCIDYLPSPLDLGRCNGLWYKWQLLNPGRLSQSAQ